MTTTRPPRRTNQSQEPQDHPDTPKRTGGATAVVVVKKVFGAETGTFFLLLGTTLFLVVFGLVMVLSSSSIDDGASATTHNDFFSSFTRQGLFALIGVPLMLIAARAPMSFWKKWARVAVLIAGLLQLLVFVPNLGAKVNGNRNWIQIGWFSAQPSELIKLGLILWIAWMAARRQHAVSEWRRVALPAALIGCVGIGLVLLGSDLGTALILALIVLGCLFYAGVRLRVLAIGVLIATPIALLLTRVGSSGATQTGSSRGNRIAAWLSGCPHVDDFQGACYQTVHAWWGIAAGGIFGSGLGESKVKWGWLPEADNDFLFAVIGDELGLIGAVLVLALFVLLAIAFVRVIRISRDPFPRIVTGGVMVWLIGQAFVNIAVVLGLLPVLGVPLPLLSAGGSSLVASLFAIGVVLSFARHAPETAVTLEGP